jgi:hydroxymethylpyrimidine/phosphomethylpyrimidine kinase
VSTAKDIGGGLVVTPKALTIAGSDSGGGAGIQADLKTFQELDVFGMSVLTAVTAQNTLGVQGVWPLSAEAVARQIDSIAEDMGTDAVKTGMLFSAEIIRTVVGKIREHRWERVVVDPVMIAKSKVPLLQEEAVEALKKELLPLALVVTPNIPEAEALTGMAIRTLDDRKEAARRIANLGARHVVVKGGHEEESEESADLLYDGRAFIMIATPRIRTSNTHGTGCTFAAAIAAELAKGRGVEDAVRTAKRFVHCAIEDGISIGHSGYGPTNHWAYRKRRAERPVEAARRAERPGGSELRAERPGGSELRTERPGRSELQAERPDEAARLNETARRLERQDGVTLREERWQP